MRVFPTLRLLADVRTLMVDDQTNRSSARGAGFRMEAHSRAAFFNGQYLAMPKKRFHWTSVQATLNGRQ